MVERLWAAGAHGVLRRGGTWREADGFLREVVMVEARGKKGCEEEEEEEEEGVYVPPFDHEDVWAGNATVIEEVAAQMGGEGAPDVV
ncbi:catabolic L-serine/threonine dehydratase, partial [Friedmanniomyces endolithicus]